MSTIKVYETIKIMINAKNYVKWAFIRIKIT